MKTTRKITSVLLAAAAVAAMSIPSFASATEPFPDSTPEPAASIYELESLPEGYEESSLEESAQGDSSESEAADLAVQESTAPKKQSDIPLFVGAGISVLVFGGVVVFCRMKGNR